MKEFKKLKFYLPMLALTGSLALLQPLNVHAEEEEEVLYEEQNDTYTQEAIDDSTAENTQTTAGQDTEEKTIEESDAENNENAAINADSNQYLDNTNYYPGTDTSENPGNYIPESAQDEVDRKLGNPGNPGKPNTPGTPDTHDNPDTQNTPETTVVPETPVTVPKMGLTLSDYNKKTLSTTAILLALAALLKMVSKIRYKIACSKELKVVSKRESEVLKENKKNKKNKKKELTK